MRIIILAALAVSACSHNAPGIEIRTISVPTPVNCVDEADVPAEPATVGDQFNGDAAHDLGILAPNALELRKWGRALRALIVPACTTVEKTP